MPREATMSRQQMETVLINAAIKIGSEQGIEKIKTREVEAVSGVNQAYLYQCFYCLDDLIKSAYIYANTKIIETLLKWLPIFRENPDCTVEFSDEMWSKCWTFLMDNVDLCRYSMRLRFSASYEKYMAEEKTYIIQNFMSSLDEKTAAQYIGVSRYTHFFDVVMMFVVKVSDGEIPNNELTPHRVFKVLSYAFLHVVEE